MIQLASKEKMPMQEEKKKPQHEFLDKLIEYAKLIQDLLVVLKVMLYRFRKI